MHGPSFILELHLIICEFSLTGVFVSVFDFAQIEQSSGWTVYQEVWTAVPNRRERQDTAMRLAQIAHNTCLVVIRASKFSHFLTQFRSFLFGTEHMFSHF